MKRISDLTTAHPAKSPAPLPSEMRGGLVSAARQSIAMPSTANINASHIDRLWMRMTNIFGHKWTSSFGAEPSETWLAGLIDMSEDEVRTGLLACLNWPEEWPPTLPQFRALCRPRREAAHQVHVRELPPPPEVREQRKASAAEALAGLREGMRLSDWLERHQGRTESALETVLRMARAQITLRATR